jgi:hypothetical protein
MRREAEASTFGSSGFQARIVGEMVRQAVSHFGPIDLECTYVDLWPPMPRRSVDSFFRVAEK